jgi:hypothetical protein
MKILGAGLAGCLAGAMNPNAQILEPLSKKDTHQALLRFRTENIGKELGIHFKKVKVYKGIWHNDKPVALSPRYIALYSRKVSDSVAYRSITNLDTTTRYVAPNELHEILRDMCSDRITYDVDIDLNPLVNTISTLPISVNADLCGYKIDTSSTVSKIYVSKFRIPDCDVYMTFYYTDPTVHMYRASITGDVLILESMWNIEENDIKVAFRSFGLHGIVRDEILSNHVQHNGKIVSINEGERKTLIYNMTINHGLYSLGRFAVWKGLLLDDVYEDILKIRSMIGKHKYDQHKEI